MYQLDETPLVKEFVLEKLKNQIMALRSDTNVRIPSERSLAEGLGVSRLSVRAALKELVKEGLLEQVQGKGTYITPLPGSTNIGIICSPDIKRTDPFYIKFLEEITNESARRSINLVMVDSNKPLPLLPDTPVIITGLLDHAILNSILSAYRPVVAIQEHPLFADITQISFDDCKIGCDAVKILYEHGHRHILHLAGPEKYPSAFYRKKGARDASEMLGMRLELATDKMNWAGGYNQGGIFLRRTEQENRPTAVFAANDWMAAGFIKRLQENGLSVPEQISVLGCDNIPLSGEYSPSISTFDLNMKLLIGEIFKVIDELSRYSAWSKRRNSANSTDIRKAPDKGPIDQAPPQVPNENDSHGTTEGPQKFHMPGSKRILLPATPVFRASIKKSYIGTGEESNG